MAEIGQGTGKTIQASPWAQADDKPLWMNGMMIAGGTNAGLIQGHPVVGGAPLPFAPPPPSFPPPPEAPAEPQE